MVRILLSGCNGHMGRVISDIVRERSDCAVVAGFDINIELKQEYPVMGEPSEYEGPADVIVDFSHPSFLPKLLSYALQRKIPAVIATTGLGAEQIEAIRQAAKEIPVFFTANMSLGISLLLELSKKAAAVLSGQFDVEIVEMHHNRKVDAPSGTALMLADGISSVMAEKPEYRYDRHTERKPRAKNEIGIHSVRGGTIVGEHEVIFAGNDEVITFKHSAASKRVFGTGAVNAALFLVHQKPGLYDMASLLNKA